MPNTTEQHSWYYPADGERDYEDTFETFFEQLDDDVEIRDSDANKSNYDPVAGAKFIATDTEDVYIGDGSSWNHLVSTGKNPSFNSIDTGEIDIGNLIAALDANGYDIVNNGTTVYDSSTDTVGDGTNDADFNSVSTGETKMGDTKIDSTTVTVADDDVQTVSVPSAESNAAMVYIRADTSATGDNGGIFNTSFGTIDTAASGSSITNQGDFTTLGGTTGPDGRLNVSKDGTDIYLENRLGASADIVVTEIS